jgi:hypothetical protein
MIKSLKMIKKWRSLKHFILRQEKKLKRIKLIKYLRDKSSKKPEQTPVVLKVLIKAIFTIQKVYQ